MNIVEIRVNVTYDLTHDQPAIQYFKWRLLHSGTYLLCSTVMANRFIEHLSEIGITYQRKNKSKRSLFQSDKCIKLILPTNFDPHTRIKCAFDKLTSKERLSDSWCKSCEDDRFFNTLFTIFRIYKFHLTFFFYEQNIQLVQTPCKASDVLRLQYSLTQLICVCTD